MLSMNNFVKIEKIKDSPFLMDTIVLAYLGDAVHSLFVRTKLVEEHDIKTGALNRLCSRIVRATSQCKMLDYILPQLNDKELDLIRRARNAKTNNIAKNATVEEYKKSTAFESLLGYYYCLGDNEKLNHILNITYDFINIELNKEGNNNDNTRKK
jgi:ribonuclease III family protein